MLRFLEDELRRQQREAAARLAGARRAGDAALADVLSGRLEDLADIARRHGLRLAA